MTKSNKSNQNFIYKVYDVLWKKTTTFKKIFFGYLIITLLGGLFLFLPISLQEGHSIKFIDALFVSSSAFSDTGLTTVTISETFSYFGQSIIFIQIILGGIGWFSIKLFIITYFLKKTKTRDYLIAQGETGSNKYSNGIIKTAVIVTFSSIIIFGIAFGITFATIAPQTYDSTTLDPELMNNWGEAMWTGFFHASSSINNAGLDIFKGSDSLQPYYGNIGIQITTLFLFILGGIGFTVIYDIYLYFKYRHTGRKFSFSLVTKISVLSYFLVAFVGLGTTYAIEASASVNNPDAFLNSSDNHGQMWWALTFNTFATRNAGFSTIDLSALSSSTLAVYSIMMFIGSGPGSTAGGIRTTTLAVLVLAVYSTVRGRKDIVVFNNKIARSDVQKSFIIFLTSLIIIITSFLSIYTVESYANSSFSFLDSVFLSFSAFGTSGLSTSTALNDLQIYSKIVLLLLMYIGKVGIINTLRALRFDNINIRTNKSEKKFTSYVEEEINLGH